MRKNFLKVMVVILLFTVVANAPSVCIQSNAKVVQVKTAKAKKPAKVKKPGQVKGLKKVKEYCK